MAVSRCHIHGVPKMWKYDYVEGKDRLVCPVCINKKEEPEKVESENGLVQFEMVEETCPQCNGTGTDRYGIEDCTRCFGSGTIKKVVE